jgi:hypothetical protein
MARPVDGGIDHRAPFEREPSGMSGFMTGRRRSDIRLRMVCGVHRGSARSATIMRSKVSGSLDGLEQPKRIGSFDRKKNVGR